MQVPSSSSLPSFPRATATVRHRIRPRTHGHGMKIHKGHQGTVPGAKEMRRWHHLPLLAFVAAVLFVGQCFLSFARSHRSLPNTTPTPTPTSSTPPTFELQHTAQTNDFFQRVDRRVQVLAGQRVLAVQIDPTAVATKLTPTYLKSRRKNQVKV